MIILYFSVYKCSILVDCLSAGLITAYVSAKRSVVNRFIETIISKEASQIIKLIFVQFNSVLNRFFFLSLYVISALGTDRCMLHWIETMIFRLTMYSSPTNILVFHHISQPMLLVTIFRSLLWSWPPYFAAYALGHHTSEPMSLKNSIISQWQLKFALMERLHVIWH